MVGLLHKLVTRNTLKGPGCGETRAKAVTRVQIRVSASQQNDPLDDSKASVRRSDKGSTN